MPVCWIMCSGNEKRDRLSPGACLVPTSALFPLHLHTPLLTLHLSLSLPQSVEPTRVTVSGNTQSLSLALSMISDVCKGTFKGFALLRQMTQQQRGPGAPHPAMLQSRPVYAPGYGLIPPSQVSWLLAACMGCEFTQEHGLLVQARREH